MKPKLIIILCLTLLSIGCGKANKHRPTEKLLPPSEQYKVSGTGSYYLGYHARVYNGSSWTITRVVVSITGKGYDENMRDKVLWTRDFCAYPTMGRIRPLTTETCIVELPDSCHGKEEPLSIREVYGYKP